MSTDNKRRNRGTDTPKVDALLGEFKGLNSESPEVVASDESPTLVDHAMASIDEMEAPVEVKEPKAPKAPVDKGPMVQFNGQKMRSLSDERAAYRRRIGRIKASYTLDEFRPAAIEAMDYTPQTTAVEGDTKLVARLKRWHKKAIAGLTTDGARALLHEALMEKPELEAAEAE